MCFHEKILIDLPKIITDQSLFLYPKQGFFWFSCVFSAVPDQVDHTAVGAAVSTISSNMPDVTKGVKTIAALMDDEDRGDRLLDAARRLCGAVSDLLGSINPEQRQVGRCYREIFIVCLFLHDFLSVLTIFRTILWYFRSFNVSNL